MRGTWEKARRTLWLKALFGAFLVGVLAFGVLFAAVISGGQDEVHGDPDIMIVLGCQVKPWGPSILLQDRLDEALDYLEAHPDMTVVVSGGQGPDEHCTEARAMADYLIQRGIPEEQILLEEDSHNTMQNFQCTAALLAEEGYELNEEVLVVSNGFHLTRARMLAERNGFERVSVLAAPSTHAPSKLKMYIREPLALVKSFVFDR